MLSSRFCCPLALALILGINLFAQAPSPSVRKENAPQIAQPGHNPLDDLIKKQQYGDLGRELAHSRLPELETDYYAGILANRENKVDLSVRLLEKALPLLKTQQAAHAAIALNTLADDYTKSFRYAEASRALEEALAQFADQFDKTEQQGMEDEFRLRGLLSETPRQTVEVHGSFTIPTHHSEIGTIDANIATGGVTRSWVLDTGANFSTVTLSFAKQLGLKVSEKQAQTQGVSGTRVPLHIAVLPSLSIGTATFHNVVLLVLEDSALNITVQNGKYQIYAILGYPVLGALGALTFFPDRIQVDPVPNTTADQGAPLYMEQLMPLLACHLDGRELPFAFDTGATTTNFSARYFRDFPKDFAALKTKKSGLSGAGGMKMLETYELPKVELDVGKTTVELDKVTVFTAPLGTDMDYVYGNLGRDLITPFRSFTLDFVNMRFVLGEKLAK
ncbi:MAG: aspartyl protease family protein [Acidobacteriia bacterium]|nr:aspartyl protease family protein [Terriglobia bacterium]